MHGLHFLKESFEAKIERFVYTFEYMLEYKLEYIFVFWFRMKNIVLINQVKTPKMYLWNRLKEI